ncbi:MAG: hypothetical protein GC200_00815 [Tepidisphaera sp.]|nr:hypothetical protein [Tepidisphaera sp.]
MKLKYQFILFAVSAAAANAGVVFQRPPSPTSGTVLTSAYWNPDGSDLDTYAWDDFLLPAAANITEIQFRGGNFAGGSTGTNVVSFDISIWASIPAGSQPDIGGISGGRLAHYTISGNANETFAGNVGGTNFYDYHATLPHAFAAAANTRYWIEIVAWQNGSPVWGFAPGTGGNGQHFVRAIAVTGDYQFYFTSGDLNFTLIGTPVGCTNPVIQSNPAPVSLCPGASPAVFSVGVTGAGPFTYRWLLNNNPLFDGPNGGGHGGGSVISGATSATITIDFPSNWADVGNYSCMVSNACGPTTSAPAALVILSAVDPACTGSPTCNPDMNQDGVADQGDVDYLINVIAGGANPTNIDPDFNHDGVADQGDVDALVNVIAGGPCP